MTDGLLHKVRMKLKQRLFLQVLLDRFKAYGLYIMPYYLVLESSSGAGPIPDYKEERPGYQACLLGLADMRALDCIDGRSESADELIRRLSAGHLCLALKIGDRVAAFTWVNMQKCDSEMEQFELSPGEAYLYDMHTIKAYRGRDLASRLRISVYSALESRGLSTFYSISERFNRSSLRFKEKLGARLLRSCLYLRLFDRLELRWVIRDYTGRPGLRTGEGPRARLVDFRGPGAGRAMR